MNEIVKYDNYMNGLKFAGFTVMDFNFLMMLCNKLRDKDTSEIMISFQELREKTKYTQHPTKQFVSDLKRMNDKLMKITCSLETETRIIMFVLFPTFEIDLEKEVLIVSVNEKFKFILNEIVKNFTRFDLKEFIELESKYSKTLYRLLKQFKTTGRYEISVDDFKEKMDSPKAYTNKQFMQNIINPALEELKRKNCFQNLICNVKYANKRGKPVTGYLFTFQPEERVQSVPQPVVQQQKPVTKKVSKPQEKKKSTNKFCNFEQHHYSKEDMELIERALLRNSENITRKNDRIEPYINE